MKNDREIVGLIPAGGRASRLGKIPLSKEIFPIIAPGSNDKISVVSENLMQYFKTAGISNVYFIIRKGKWDIPDYFGDGSEIGMNIGYLLMNLPYGTPFTLNQAYPFVKDKIIALGYPDILIKPANCYSVLVQKFRNIDADIILGIFPITNYLKWDMIEFDDQKNIRNIVVKQNRPDLQYGWTVALWNSEFSRYINNYLITHLKKNPDGMLKLAGFEKRELYVGDIIQQAILDKLKVDYVKFENGSCIDIGTISDLKKYLQLTIS
jgi:glucose-1-phosphate thymidylyltransferase